MMSSYTATDFLLDRANIHDIVVKLYLYSDRKQWDKFEEIIAPEMILDYTAMFGGQPRTVSPAALVETWKPFLNKLTRTQHVMASILINLPQPGSTTEKVTKATVDANAIVNLIREGFEGGDRTSNGGRGELEVFKISDDPAFGNPWRISGLRVIPVWMAGNTKILTD